MKNFRNFSRIGEALLVIYLQKEFNCKNPDKSLFRKAEDADAVNEIVLHRDNCNFSFHATVAEPGIDELWFWSLEKGIYRITAAESGHTFMVVLPDDMDEEVIAKSTHLVHKTKSEDGSKFFFDIYRFPVKQREGIIILSSKYTGKVNVLDQLE